MSRDLSIRIPVSGGRYRDDELVAQSERDGEAGWGENYNPDAMMSRDGRNAPAAAEYCSHSPPHPPVALAGQAGATDDGAR